MIRHNMRAASISLVALAVLLTASGAAAQGGAWTLPVTSLDDSTSQGALRWAIGQYNTATAPQGTTAVVISVTVSGTITLQSPLAINAAKTSLGLTIANNSGGVVTLSGGGAVQILTINTAGPVTLQGLSFISGMVMQDNDIEGFGGALYATGQQTNVTLESCSFSGCSASNDGGAVWNGATMTITDGSFTQNSASSGGAIYNIGTMTINGGSVTGNSAVGWGGGILNDWVGGESTTVSSGTLSITGGCQISANTATYGGGISNNGSAGDVYNPSNIVPAQNSDLPAQGGTLNINNATIANHVSSSEGGAIYLMNGECNLTDVTMSGNSTSGSGGAIYVQLGLLNMTGCTLSGNKSAVAGGALYAETNAVTIYAQNCSFSSNSASQQGGALALQAQPDLVNTPFLWMNNCAVTGNSCGSGGSGPAAGGVNWQTGASLIINTSFSKNTCSTAWNGMAGGLLCGRFTQLLSCSFDANSVSASFSQSKPAMAAAGGALFYDGQTNDEDGSGPIYACKVVGCLFTNNIADAALSYYVAGGMLIMPVADPDSAQIGMWLQPYAPYLANLIGMVSQSLFQSNSANGAVYSGAGGLNMYCSDYSFVSNCLIGGMQSSQGNSVSTPYNGSYKGLGEAGGLQVNGTNEGTSWVVSGNVIAYNQMNDTVDKYCTAGGVTIRYMTNATLINNTIAFNNSAIASANGDKSQNATAVNVMGGIMTLIANTIYNNTTTHHFSGSGIIPTICAIANPDNQNVSVGLALLGNYIGQNGEVRATGSTNDFQYSETTTYPTWMGSYGYNMIDKSATDAALNDFLVSTDQLNSTDCIPGSTFTTPGNVPFPVLMPAAGSLLQYSENQPKNFPNTDTRGFLRPPTGWSCGSCDPAATQRSIQNITISPFSNGVGNVSIQNSPVQLVNFDPSSVSKPVQGYSGVFVSVGDNLIAPTAKSFSQSKGVWTTKGNFGPYNKSTYTLTFNTNTQTWSLATTNTPLIIESYTFNGVNSSSQPYTQTINGVMVSLYINTDIYSDFYITSQTFDPPQTSPSAAAPPTATSTTKTVPSEKITWNFNEKKQKQSDTTHMLAGRLNAFSLTKGSASFDALGNAKESLSLSGTFDPPEGKNTREAFDQTGAVTVMLGFKKYPTPMKEFTSKKKGVYTVSDKQRNISLTLDFNKKTWSFSAKKATMPWLAPYRGADITLDIGGYKGGCHFIADYKTTVKPVKKK